jgi:hypothetical protein
VAGAFIPVSLADDGGFPVALRVSGDDRGSDRQMATAAQHGGAVIVAGFVAVSGGDEDAGVVQQHR